ncbi:MAG: hypothetical protein ACOY3Y_12145, partial [Acidobacteriota bacterium]
MLEVRELVTSTLPGCMAEDLHIRARPSAMELAGGRVRPPGPCAWCELLDQPFEVPSLVAADLGSPLGGTMFGLDESDRAALSALAVRHQWTGSGYVSAVLPVAFQGGEQMDLQGFASTSMIEPGMSANPETLNDLLSIWTFGGWTG